MALQVPLYQTSFNKNYKFENVIAWVAFMACDFVNMSGQIMLNVSMDVEASSDGSDPIGQEAIATGQVFPTGETDENGVPTFVQFPDLTEIITANQEAFDSIRAYLYNEIAKLPKFKDAVNV